MYNKLIDIGFKTLWIYAIFVFCELCLIMVYPKITEDLLEISQLIQHYQQYNNSNHKQKIESYKKIANKHIDEFMMRTGFNSFRPNIYVFPHSHIYGKTTELNAIAYCNVDSGNIIILTDDDFNNVFFKKDSYLAQSVMYHELGHCLYKLKHKDNEFNVMNGEVQYSNKKFSGTDFNRYLYQLSYGMDKYDETLDNLKVTDFELSLMKNDSKIRKNVFSFKDQKTLSFFALFDVDLFLKRFNDVALVVRYKIEKQFIKNK